MHKHAAQSMSSEINTEKTKRVHSFSPSFVQPILVAKLQTSVNDRGRDTSGSNANIYIRYVQSKIVNSNQQVINETEY